MMRVLAGLAAGLLFGAGLSVSAMINPAKVLNFLDIAGTWDPSLLLVMAGAVAVTFAGYRLVLRRDRPLLETSFAVPTRRDLDPALIGGAALFGIGWGLGGYCPGPAISGLAYGAAETLAFVGAMVAGMLTWRLARRAWPTSAAAAAGKG
ncbi:MAG: YeeE/YedE family protein [Rhodospirillales bacterium]|nr:MAG: YeeE/YedE family protein [Rhodospirillales bacterium]